MTAGWKKVAYHHWKEVKIGNWQDNDYEPCSRDRCRKQAFVRKIKCTVSTHLSREPYRIYSFYCAQYCFLESCLSHSFLILWPYYFSVFSKVDQLITFFKTKYSLSRIPGTDVTNLGWVRYWGQLEVFSFAVFPSNKSSSRFNAYNWPFALWVWTPFFLIGALHSYILEFPKAMMCLSLGLDYDYSKC